MRTDDAQTPNAEEMIAAIEAVLEKENIPYTLVVHSGALRAARDFISEHAAKDAAGDMQIKELEAEEDRLRDWRRGLPDVVCSFGSSHPDNAIRRDLWRSLDIGSPTPMQIAVDRLREFIAATELWLDELCDAAVSCVAQSAERPAKDAAVATSFDVWLAAQSKGAHYPGSSASGYARQGWDARQKEIDAKDARIEELERWKKKREMHACPSPLGNPTRDEAMAELTTLRAENATLSLRYKSLEDLNFEITHDRDRISAENAEMRKWRPIEMAPKDGREVLLVVKQRAGMDGCMLVGHYMRGGHCIDDHPPIDRGWYFWNGCFFDRASEPIAWMPLPELQPAAELGLTAPQPKELLCDGVSDGLLEGQRCGRPRSAHCVESHGDQPQCPSGFQHHKFHPDAQPKEDRR